MGLDVVVGYDNFGKGGVMRWGRWASAIVVVGLISVGGSLAASPPVACPEGFVCVPRLSPAELSDMDEWQKDLGIVAFTIPQASSIAQRLIHEDQVEALAKLGRNRLGFYSEFGFRADTTDSVGLGYGEFGLRWQPFKGIGLVGGVTAFGSDAAVKGGLRIEW